MKIEPEKLLEKYYKNTPELLKIILTHSKLVTAKALEIANNVPELNPNKNFIKNAAMLHDIGICKVTFKDSSKEGRRNYLRHGIIGTEILRGEGLSEYARVCEVHTGVGITKEEIIRNKLPLPHRDLIPETTEEEIISLADLSYSKHPDPTKEMSIKDIKTNVSKFGEFQKKKIDELLKKYKLA